MKKIDDIFTHIRSNSDFSKIDTFLELKKFVNILPLKLKSGIEYTYTKNSVLHIVLLHQQYINEFKGSMQLIKSLLAMVNLSHIEDIKLKVSNNIVKKNIQKDDESYEERSYGIFDNYLTDKELYNRFENIRKVIKDF